MQVRYFVFHNSRNQGPFTYNEIERMVDQAELFPTDFVYLTDIGDWVPILEFIMVQGPKHRVTAPALQTLGANSPNDSQVDYRRFASAMPPGRRSFEERIRNSDSAVNIYPAPPEAPDDTQAASVETLPDFPPPPLPPRAVVERKALMQHQRRPAVRPPSQPPPNRRSLRPAPPAKQQRIPRESRATFVRPLDVGARVVVEVRPGRATRLEIEVCGGSRVGETIDVLVRAVDDAGNIDREFAGLIHLLCNRRAEGAGLLHFISGVAHQRVTCLEAGQYEFSLQADPAQTAESDEEAHEQEQRLLFEEAFSV